MGAGAREAVATVAASRLPDYHPRMHAARQRSYEQRVLGLVGAGVVGGAALLAVGLGACKSEPPNVPDECSSACGEHEYCVAKVVGDASVSTECRPEPSFCKEGPDMCECIRRSKGPPHYHCVPSDAGVILQAP